MLRVATKRGTTVMTFPRQTNKTTKENNWHCWMYVMTSLRHDNPHVIGAIRLIKYMYVYMVEEGVAVKNHQI